MIGLSLKGLSKHFASNHETLRALSDVSLDVHPNDFVLVVGPNGSGKSTLLNLISGREIPDSGIMRGLESGREYDWLGVGRKRRAEIVAYVQQDPRAGTAQDLTVLENLRLAGLSRRTSPFRPALPRSESKRMRDFLSLTPILAKANSLAGDLSHGQRQMLTLEMAAIRHPKLILLDEFTASLDARNSELCMNRIATMHRELGATVIAVTHDLTIPLKYGNRLLVLRDGQIAADIPAEQKASLQVKEILELSGLRL